MSDRLPDDCFALPPGVDWTPVDVALARLRARLSCVCPVSDGPPAPGTVLAEDALARRDAPPTANAAVDGYAFGHDGAGAGAAADLVLADGRAAPGHPWHRPLPKGWAVRILTGASIPLGADTVVLQEDCTVTEGRVRFKRPNRAGANVRPQGEDARAGNVVLAGGTRLGPQHIARLISVDAAARVRTPLAVAVLSTGDELVKPGGEDLEGIPDANGPMLVSFLERQGHRALELGRAADRAEAVRVALDRGAAAAQAILTTGGASAGDEDHISRLLRAEGRIETWRIAVKPGRPLALGMWNGVPVFGLPGNPVAAFICALIFVRPALSAMAGTGWLEPQVFEVPAAFEKRKKPGRREYLRARLTPEGAAEVYHSEGSGLIGGLTWAHGLVELEDAARNIRAGDPVRYLPFTGFGL